MHPVLRPGTRLLRSMGVTGRFALIALLLLVPLAAGVGSDVADTWSRLDATAHERDGVRYAVPVVELLVDVGHTARAPRAVPDPVDVARIDPVAAVDAVDAELGQALGVDDEWRSAREAVLAVRSPGIPAQERTRRAIDAGLRLQSLVASVARASGAGVDPAAGTHRLLDALVDGLPRAVLTLATPPAPRSGGPSGPGAVTHLLLDLTGTVGNDPGAGVPAPVLAAVRALAVAAGAGDAETGAAAGAALARALGSAVDDLLEARRTDLLAHRLPPAGLSTLFVLVTVYLLVALYRLTRAEVGAVLADISSITDGALHQSAPLEGSDEFARMSREVVYARDHLTSLLGTLRYQGTHDDLTALPNRQQFNDKLAEVLAVPGSRVAVVLVDLDGFTDVNDSFGHDVGDRLLRSVAARFHRAVDRGDLVARTGADEFAVLLLDVAEGLAAMETVARLQGALAQPVELDGRRLAVRAAMGVALGEGGRVSAVELARNADVALNAAHGRDTRVVTFEPALQERTRERTELSVDLVQALEHGELAVVYQPIVDLGTDLVHGVEALVRWNHPTRGPVPPSVFVPLAEATGLIVPVGRWVLRQAVEQLARWRAELPGALPLTLEVNVSAAQLADPALVDEVRELLAETGVDPRSLVLEITESALVADLDAALPPLRRLAASGVRLALDDFGTGYSSLTYLRRLPASMLKVDRSFVEDTDGDDRAATVLLRGVIDLGRGLGMQVVAEGVQSAAHLQRVRDAGGHLGQGYLWSAPLSADEVAAVLRAGGRIRPTGFERVTSA